MRSRAALRIASTFAACIALTTHGRTQPTPTLADTMQQRMAACGICHGEQGEGRGAAEYYPRISGKPADYLFTQLQHFRDGRRKYPQMVYLMRYMDDRYLREIAAYYAALQPAHLAPAKPSPDARERQRGEVLVTRGDTSKSIPACAGCHGRTLTGMAPGIPGLVGLPVDYIAAQLGAWKTGLRVATPPDCMLTIAQRMSGSDIAAVAKWLGSQPPPADVAKLAPPVKLPLRCGNHPA